jgi:hypothetical protein
MESMRLIFTCCALGAILASSAAHAMMAPKFERARALWAALEHLSEISSMLAEPIDKIEYVDGVVRFSAGHCFVPVTVEYGAGSAASGPPALGGGSWSATVGAA